MLRSAPAEPKLRLQLLRCSCNQFCARKLVENLRAVRLLFDRFRHAPTTRNPAAVGRREAASLRIVLAMFTGLVLLQVIVHGSLTLHCAEWVMSLFVMTHVTNDP